jgi:hypothetical protein
VVSRRLFDMLKKQYLKCDDRKQNIQIDRRGLEYIDLVRARVRKHDTIQLDEDDRILDDDEVWELETMKDTCTELAESLGEEHTVTALNKRWAEKDPIVMSGKEFEAESRRIIAELERLRAEYAKAFGKDQKAA